MDGANWHVCLVVCKPLDYIPDHAVRFQAWHWPGELLVVVLLVVNQHLPHIGEVMLEALSKVIAVVLAQCFGCGWIKHIGKEGFFELIGMVIPRVGQIPIQLPALTQSDEQCHVIWHISSQWFQ